MAKKRTNLKVLKWSRLVIIKPGGETKFTAGPVTVILEPDCNKPDYWQAYAYSGKICGFWSDGHATPQKAVQDAVKILVMCLKDSIRENKAALAFAQDDLKHANRELAYRNRKLAEVQATKEALGLK